MVKISCLKVYGRSDGYLIVKHPASLNELRILSKDCLTINNLKKIEFILLYKIEKLKQDWAIVLFEILHPVLIIIAKKSLEKFIHAF